MVKNSLNKPLFLIGLIAVLALSSCTHRNDPYKIARKIPVQFGGRVGSFDAFCAGLLKEATGSERHRGRPAYRIVLDAVTQSADTSFMPEIPLDTLRLIPAPEGAVWPAVAEGGPRAEGLNHLLAAYKARDVHGFRRKTSEWIRDAATVSPEASELRIGLDVLYRDASPFSQAAGAYAIAFLLLAFLRLRTIPRFLGCVIFMWGFLFHTTGLAMRWIILARPPVANMYESMAFMSWTLVVLAIGFFVVQKNSIFLSAGAAISAVIVWYAGLLPLDASMGVLMPVLKSNFWLIVHVMMIITGYGAFGLGMGIGHWCLIQNFRMRVSPWKAYETTYLLQKILEIGLVFLFFGTVTGGVWANVSWGRFWGWDPKETWALITFLCYLLIIHLRYKRQLNDFRLAVGSILGFLVVILTWYGVNFLLGQGLHSYGEVSGGTLWVAGYFLFEFIFIGVMIIFRRHRSN